MDWAVFWAAVAGIVSSLVAFGLLVWWGLSGYFSAVHSRFDTFTDSLDRDILAVRHYADSSIKSAIAEHQIQMNEKLREHIEDIIDGKLAQLATDITTRINGTYMRTPEAHARFADLQRQIDDLK